jgi:hypothetical protein
MIDPSAAIPKWARIAIRTVGTANALLVLVGTLFLADSAHFFLTSDAADRPNIPYFRFAFVAMMLINVVFLAVLMVTAVRFIQVRISSINSYSLAVLVLVVYGYAIGVLWRAGRGIGMSIAAATGVGNMGLAPFEFCFLVPYLYPVASIVLLQVLKRRYSTQHTFVSAGR